MQEAGLHGRGERWGCRRLACMGGGRDGDAGDWPAWEEGEMGMQETGLNWVRRSASVSVCVPVRVMVDDGSG